MFTVRCPICEQPMQGHRVAEWPFFPFCGQRCKTIDLGRWLTSSYGIEAEEPDDRDDIPEVNTP